MVYCHIAGSIRVESYSCHQAQISEHGISDVMQVMSEWLAEKKLDRKLLGTLSANLAAVEAWEEWEADQVLTVLENLVAEVVGEPREVAAKLDIPEASDDEVPSQSPTTRKINSEQCMASADLNACSPGQWQTLQQDTCKVSVLFSTSQADTLSGRSRLTWSSRHWAWLSWSSQRRTRPCQTLLQQLPLMRQPMKREPCPMATLTCWMLLWTPAACHLAMTSWRRWR